MSDTTVEPTEAVAPVCTVADAIVKMSVDAVIRADCNTFEVRLNDGSAFRVSWAGSGLIYHNAPRPDYTPLSVV